jgi:hypothetical protein
MKILLLQMFVLVNIVIGQKDLTDRQNLIKGLISTNQGIFLVLEDGYAKVENYDAYQEYYRAIYNDSTIVNPNMEIRGNYQLKIFPYLIPTIESEKCYMFNEPIEFGLFFQLNNSNNYELSEFGKSYLDSLLVDTPN